MSAHWTLFCDQSDCGKRLTLKPGTGDAYQLADTVYWAEQSFGWASLKTASPTWRHYCPDHRPDRDLIRPAALPEEEAPEETTT